MNKKTDIQIYLQKNMLFDPMERSHSQLTVPDEFVWLAGWGARAVRGLNTVLKIDRFSFHAHAEKKR
jgi:hypothetical protein